MQPDLLVIRVALLYSGLQVRLPALSSPTLSSEMVSLRDFLDLLLGFSDMATVFR